MEKNNLEVLKQRYSEIQAKHNLPGFQELNEEFGIEKTEVEKFDILIREIRRYVADKLLNYLRLVETLLNPSNAPMFIFSIIKTLDCEDKNKLGEIYKSLAKLELDLIELDLLFNENKEAEFIKKGSELWKKVSPDLMSLVGKVRLNWGTESKKTGASFIG